MQWCMNYTFRSVLKTFTGIAREANTQQDLESRGLKLSKSSRMSGIGHVLVEIQVFKVGSVAGVLVGLLM